MRIIAGTARRRILEVADGSSTRPFLEMARGALFNSLGPRVAGARVLDLYAGSGALGLEALSRGAERCLFVEQDRRAGEALERNIRNCGFAGQSRRLLADVGRALAGLDETFDLTFVDPPFPELAEWQAGGGAEGIMRHAARLLAPGGLLVFRLEDGGIEAPEWPELTLRDARKYGRSGVLRYGRIEEGEQP